MHLDLVLVGDMSSRHIIPPQIPEVDAVPPLLNPTAEIMKEDNVI